MALNVLYEESRGIAHSLHPSPFYRPQLDAEKFLFFGHVPTIVLQDWLWTGSLHWYDQFLSFMTRVHFIVPPTLAFCLWLKRRALYYRFAATLLVLSYAGAFTFWLYPAAPPWAAAYKGLIPPVANPAGAQAATSPLPTDSGPLYHLVSDNPYAAIPSLHEGYAMLVFLFIVMLAWNTRWRWWVTGTALLYPIIQSSRSSTPPTTTWSTCSSAASTRPWPSSASGVCGGGWDGPSERHADRGPVLAGAGARAGSARAARIHALPAHRVRGQPHRGVRAAGGGRLDVAGATGVGPLLPRALRPARPVGRGLVPLDRRARVRPGDRPRQRGRLLPPVSADVAGRRRPAGADDALGSLLSSAAFGAALCLLYTVTQRRYDERMARRTVLYLAIFPLTFVFALPYAESLFLLLALGAFVLTLARALVVGLGSRRAGGARPAGGDVLVPALAWRRYRTEGLRWRAYLPLLLMPAAELAFFLYLGWRTGNFMASPDAQERGWGRGVSILPWVVVHTLWHDVLEGGHLRFLIHIGFTLLWCGLFYKAWRMRMPGEYLIFAALAVLLPTSGGLLVSMGRFGMVAFPLFWALAELGEDERIDTFVKTSFPLLLGALVMITYTARTFTP